MKRWLARTVVCLILGAVTTVAVAWACYSLTSLRDARSIEGMATIHNDDWELRVTSKPGKARLAIASHPRPEWTCSLVRNLRDAPKQLSLPDLRAPAWSSFASLGHDESSLHIEEACGWPALALRCEYHMAVRLLCASIREARRDPAMLDQMAEMVHKWTSGAIILDVNDHVLLPYDVIWSGFIADSAAFAGSWMFVLFGVGRIRRVRRARRGLCPRCKYDLRGDLERGCPECGWRRQR